jgi:hypothetical protein
VVLGRVTEQTVRRYFYLFTGTGTAEFTVSGFAYAILQHSMLRIYQGSLKRFLIKKKLKKTFSILFLSRNGRVYYSQREFFL